MYPAPSSGVREDIIEILGGLASVVPCSGRNDSTEHTLQVIQTLVAKLADSRSRMAPTNAAFDRSSRETARAHLALVAILLRTSDRTDRTGRLDLPRLARAVGYSKWHLSRRLGDLVPGGFQRLLAAVRLLDAVALLRTTDLPVKDVAWRAGYASTSALSHHVHGMLGLTPTSARRFRLRDPLRRRPVRAARKAPSVK